MKKDKKEEPKKEEGKDEGKKDAKKEPEKGKFAPSIKNEFSVPAEDLKYNVTTNPGLKKSLH